MAYLFLILHIVGLAGYNLILRKSLNKKINPLFLATVMQTGIAIPMLFILPFYFPDFSNYSSSISLQIFITAVLVIMLHLTNVNALKYLEAGVYSIIYNLRILFTTFLGIIFLSEDIVPLQIAGGLLIFLAIITVRQKGKSQLTTKGVYWGVAASLVISVLNLSEKDLLSSISYLDYAIPVMILSSIMMWAILLTSRHKPDYSLFRNKRIIQLMVFRSVSAYSFTLAFYTGALLSVATYISSLSVIVIVILGILLLNENDYLKQKIIATSLAALGLTLIFISSLT